MTRKTETSTEVKARWNAANYKTYRVNLRYDRDQELIDFVDKFKAAHERDTGVTEIFRAGVEALMAQAKQ